MPVRAGHGVLGVRNVLHVVEYMLLVRRGSLRR